MLDVAPPGDVAEHDDTACQTAGCIPEWCATEAEDARVPAYLNLHVPQRLARLERGEEGTQCLGHSFITFPVVAVQRLTYDKAGFGNWQQLSRGVVHTD